MQFAERLWACRSVVQLRPSQQRLVEVAVAHWFGSLFTSLIFGHDRCVSFVLPPGSNSILHAANYTAVTMLLLVRAPPTNELFYRLAWVDQSSGDQLTFCGTRCAYASGAQHLVGQLKCSLPGCNEFTMRHELTMAELGYCSDIHRVKAEERMLVR